MPHVKLRDHRGIQRMPTHQRTDFSTFAVFMVYGMLGCIIALYHITSILHVVEMCAILLDMPCFRADPYGFMQSMVDFSSISLCYIFWLVKTGLMWIATTKMFGLCGWRVCQDPLYLLHRRPE
jgi:hypothetical protein